MLVIGQDVTLFSSVGPGGSLVLNANVIGSQSGAYRFLVVPQAWSISLELMFYAIAPFLLRLRLHVLFILLGGSVALRLALMLAGLDHDPWTYRFFPTALACFLLGAISFRLGESWRKREAQTRVGVIGVTLAAALLRSTEPLHRLSGSPYPTQRASHRLLRSQRWFCSCRRSSS